MSNHQVIARKWRPQKFGDVVGQTHVIRTLRNAIAGNRVGHAYLLVGPRGIGKTTIARIFAKAINCEHPVDGEPCCQCSSCLALASESSLDVIEINAASRNSVEHMRALSEEAYHMPVASKYKIYIIDEVHMLSKAAWNALLKTVEEPPAHVKFIFATTEAHLVLPTIVSRCQRFDLRPIAGNLILGRLKLIAESENVKIAPEALSAIARAAEGGMRDAQSSLEQMLAFFGGKDQEIAAEQVLELFGLTNAVELDTLIAALLQNQPGPVVTIVNQLAGRGRNLETLFEDVLEMLRGAELMHILNRPETVLDFDDEKLSRCRKLASLTRPEVLRCFMENLAPVGRVLHEALNKAIYLESILLKAMNEAHAPTVGDVLNRLNQLRGAGELEFINQIPSFQQNPPITVMPTVLPELPAETVAAVEKTIPDQASAVADEKAIPVVEKAPETAAEPEIEVSEDLVNEEIEPTENIPAESTAIEEASETALVSEGLSQYEALFNQLTSAVEDENLAAVLRECSAQSLINSVLSINVPTEYMEVLRSNRIKLLSLLQKISGNWAILLDFRSSGTVATSVADIPATAPLTESAMPEQVQEPVVEEFIEISAGNEISEEEFFQQQSLPPPAETSNVVDTAEEEYIEVNSEEHSESGSAEESTYVYTKRSVIHKTEEVAATAQLPPVQKVLDLFGGEIVDIHA